MRRSRLIHRGGSSTKDFAGVAKVVFESARKSGVVLEKGSHQSSLLYSRLLQQHAKPQVQSIDLVVLAADRNTVPRPATTIAAPRRLGSPANDSVPLLDLPFLDEAPKHKSSAATVAPDKPQKATEKAAPSPQAQPAAAMPGIESLLETSLSFDFASTHSNPSASSVTPPPARAATTTATTTTVLPTTATSAPSAADWEILRQAEVNRLLESQQAEEERRKEAQRERAVAAESEQWLRSRTLVGTSEAAAAAIPNYDGLLRMYHGSWEEALQAFLQVEPVARKPYHFTMVLSKLEGDDAMLQTRDADARRKCVEQVLKLARDSKVPPPALLQAKLQLLLSSSPPAAAAAFMEAPSATKTTLPPHMLKRCVRAAVRFGSWEVGLQLNSLLKSRIRDPFCFIEAAIFDGLAQKPFSSEMQQSVSGVIDALSRQLRDQMPELGKHHTLAVARATRRWQGANAAREVVSRFASQPEADEAVMGFLLSVARPEQREQLASEMQSMSISAADPAVLTGTMISFSKEKDYAAALSALVNAKLSPNFRYTSGLAAATIHLAAVEKSRKAAVLAVEAFGACVADKTQKFNVLVPVLYAQNMVDEAVALFDHHTIDSALLSANSIGCLNMCLKAKSRKPLSAQLPSTDAAQAAKQSASGGSSNLGAAAVGVSSATSTSTQQQQHQQHPAVEKMLEFAKSRQWRAALQLLGSLDQTPSTLLYNCALSAAMDNVGVVEQLLDEMRSRQVPANSTTYNTVMSVYSLNERWDDALAVFSTMEPKARDAGSFSVILAALGKRGMWTDAMSVLTIAQTEGAAPPSAAVFSLAMQAVHKHSWECSLSIFTDMYRTLGAPQIKEIVVSRVMRALEGAGKTREMQMVDDIIKGKTKKKKAAAAATPK